MPLRQAVNVAAFFAKFTACIDKVKLFYAWLILSRIILPLDGARL